MTAPTTPTTLAANPDAVGWRFDNTYTRLPDRLFSPARPKPVKEPKVVVLNHRLADELGLNLRTLPAGEAAALFAGLQVILFVVGSHVANRFGGGRRYRRGGGPIILWGPGGGGWGGGSGGGWGGGGGGGGFSGGGGSFGGGGSSGSW